MSGMSLSDRFNKLRKDLTVAPQDAPRPDDGLGQLASALGLEYRPSKRKAPAYLRGAVDGHRIAITVPSSGRTKIKVKFDSGLRDLSLRPRSSSTKLITNREDLSTGDAEFDARYRLLGAPGAAADPLVAYLTPERRTVLVALDDAFDVDEIEEDDLEVYLPAEASITELREAIEVCLLAASSLAADIADAV